MPIFLFKHLQVQSCGVLLYYRSNIAAVIIESIRTSIKAVICSKISLKVNGFLPFDSFPVSPDSTSPFDYRYHDLRIMASHCGIVDDPVFVFLIE